MSNLASIKQFIVDELVPDSHSDEIPNDLDLLQSGVLDSLAVLRMVAFIEDEFDIALQPDEIDPANFKSIDAIAELVDSKLKSATPA